MNDQRIRFHSHRLPKTIHDYLTLISQRGNTMPLGVFELRARSYQVAANPLPTLLCIAGLIATLALSLSHVPTFESDGALDRFREVSENTRWLSAAAFAAFMAGLALIVRRWRLHRQFPFPTPFAYLDGIHYWVVGRDFVDAHPVADSTGLGYTAPTLKVFAPATQPVEITFADVRLIQFAGAFLQRVQKLRETISSRREAAVQAWSSMCMDPALALQSLAAFQMPEKIPGDGAAPLGNERVAQFKLGGALALGSAALAAIAVPFVLVTMQHAIVLRHARTETSGLLGPRAYLERFSNGTYAAAMADELDNRWFSRALADSRTVRSASPLEAYLADARNRLNRTRAEEQIDELTFTWGKEDLASAESPVRLKEYLADRPNGQFAAQAQALVDGFYAAAEARLQTAVAAAKDRSLVRALLGLVTLVSTRIDPTVTVGFKGSVNLEGTESGIAIDAAPAFSQPV
jgi:hypothetical protein